MTWSLEERTGALYGGLVTQLAEEDFLRLADVYVLRGNIQSSWVAGKRCLDVGCGSGRVIYALSRLGAGLVVGIDVGSECLEQSTRRNAGHAQRVRLCQASALQLPFSGGVFDFANCTGVLHHTRDPRQGFAELARVTRQGGRVAVGLYAKSGLFPVVVTHVRPCCCAAGAASLGSVVGGPLIFGQPTNVVSAQRREVLRVDSPTLTPFS